MTEELVTSHEISVKNSEKDLGSVPVLWDGPWNVIELERLLSMLMMRFILARGYVGAKSIMM